MGTDAARARLALVLLRPALFFKGRGARVVAKRRFLLNRALGVAELGDERFQALVALILLVLNASAVLRERCVANVVTTHMRRGETKRESGDEVTVKVHIIF
jgi:hypothetical protein